MLDFQKLLSYGYFPPELPPCFSSEEFGKSATLIDRLISQANCNTKDRSTSVPLRFSAYKSEASRRRFSVANPFHFAKAARQITDSSDDLFEVFGRSSASLTKPLDRATSKKSFSRPSESVADTKRSLKRFYSNSLYEVRLDMQSFFGSIYTHSIPWAIHSKKTAKKQRGAALCGNLLDECMRNMNDGQTNGILAGNDVSRIISEVILCALDAEIAEELGSKSFRRFVDDYFFFTNSSSEVERIISTVRKILSSYELELNESKVQITKSPLIFDNRFVDEVKSLLKLEPAAFLEHLVFSYSQTRDMRPMRYGLKTLQNVVFSGEEWREIEPYHLNIWLSTPVLSDAILPIFEANVGQIRKNHVKRTLYSIIDTHLPPGNDLEVVWALWGAIALDIGVSQEYLRTILESTNWLAIILVLDIIDCKGIRQSKEVKPRIEKLRKRIHDDYFSNGTTRGMCSEIRLLAYEATCNKWLNTGGGKNEGFSAAKSDAFFGELFKQGISFYRRPQKSVRLGPSIEGRQQVEKKEAEIEGRSAGLASAARSPSEKGLSLGEIIRMSLDY